MLAWLLVLSPFAIGIVVWFSKGELSGLSTVIELVGVIGAAWWLNSLLPVEKWGTGSPKPEPEPIFEYVTLDGTKGEALGCAIGTDEAHVVSAVLVASGKYEGSKGYYCWKDKDGKAIFPVSSYKPLERSDNDN